MAVEPPDNYEKRQTHRFDATQYWRHHRNDFVSTRGVVNGFCLLSQRLPRC